MKLYIAALACLVCLSPVSALSGITVTDLSALVPQVSVTSTSNNFLSGVAFIDYDQDHDLDAVIANGVGSPNFLLENDGAGNFAVANVGIGDLNGHLGVIVGDINNDGCQDIYFGGEGGVVTTPTTAHTLYISRCGGADGDDFTFFEDAAARFPFNPPTAGMATFGDIDNDGDLDLFIAGAGQTANNMDGNAVLFRNDGGFFTDISAQSNIDAAPTLDIGTCVATFAHYDDDDLIDLFTGDCVVNGAVIGSLLAHVYQNLGGGVFVEQSLPAGVQVRMGSWMGITFADYDNDGDQDFFTSNAGTAVAGMNHVLWRNNGDLTFTNDMTTIGNFEFGWGAMFADFNLDGLQDIVVVGTASNTPGAQVNPGVISRNNGDGTFTRQADLGFTAPDVTSSVAVADIDNNGTPDILVGRRDTTGLVLTTPFLGRTDLDFDNRNNWANIRLVGTVSNRDAVGARVTLRARGVIQSQTVLSGEGAFGSRGPWLNFGLGNANDIDLLTIRWPTGRVEEFSNINTVNRLLTFVEGQGQDNYFH